MKHALPSFVKFILIALISCAQLAYANEEKVQPKADPAKGSTLYAGGDPARGVMACVACHGAAGNSSITQNPKLAGQHQAYLQKQLYQFREPVRNNAIMTAIAARPMTNTGIACQRRPGMMRKLSGIALAENCTVLAL